MNPLKSKRIHLGAKINVFGHVSPLCATTPRKIDLRRSSWTIVPRTVNCPKCLAILKTQRIAILAGAKQEADAFVQKRGFLPETVIFVDREEKAQGIRFDEAYKLPSLYQLTNCHELLGAVEASLKDGVRTQEVFLR